MLENVTFKKEAIFRDLKARKKKELLRVFCGSAAEVYGLDGHKLFEEVWRRENLVSTCVGSNVALPHCRLAGVDRLCMAVAIWEKGVNFDSPGGDLIKIAILIVAPEGKLEADYLALLALLARVLRRESNRMEFFSRSDEELVRWIEEKAA
jgi:PTS system nitrogen regulatory IIA component